MKIGIIDYGVGNLASIQNALDKLGVESVMSSDLIALKKTDALILPGDGAAGKGMENLKNLGLDVFLKKEIKKKKPFLGICLGMQLLMDFSEEGNVECLGVIKGKVKKISLYSSSESSESRSQPPTIKIPQIGWNTICHSGKSEGRIQNQKRIDPGQARMTLLKGIKNDTFFYFINSYICKPDDSSIVIGETDYGETFCSAFEKENVFGVQFHPEKSGDAGEIVLKNFLEVI